MDFDRPTNSGDTMWGNTTMSLKGSSGRVMVDGPPLPAGSSGLNILGICIMGFVYFLLKKVIWRFLVCVNVNFLK